MRRWTLMTCAVVVGLILTSPRQDVLSSQQATRATQQPSLSATQQLARAIYQELIEINTTDSIGNMTQAAEAMAARLKSAGFPAADVQVLVSKPRKGNLVARLHGSGARRPLLLLAHLDVVEAKRADWSLDPFKLTEKDGYFYGRGTTDDKAMAAIWIATLIRLKSEGFIPDRDIIVALTTDEEGGDDNGVDWLVKNHRPLIDAAYALNEGGGGEIKKGKRLLNEVQASEKVYQTYTLEVTNKGGHSSLPEKDNAIYRLAAGLDRLSTFDFPVELNEVTRTYFTRMSAIQTGQVAADMKAITQTLPPAAAAARLATTALYNALMRTTCVATQLQGGHAENALPQRATATVNCRILPGVSPAVVRQTLTRVVADTQIKVTPLDSFPGPPSPLNPEVMGPIELITTAMWPGIPVVPFMATGATDGVYLRAAGIPTYGVSGIFEDIDDIRAHGKDERLLVTSFYEGQEFLYRLVKALSSKK
jgi:acetylornithine deacetylase/succinyl-diaminopimelate desuccinylase-like protein